MDKLVSDAETALAQLRATVLAFVKTHTRVRNDQVARHLKLETHFEGGQRNYLTFSILSILVQNGQVSREKVGNRVYYTAV